MMPSKKKNNNNPPVTIKPEPLSVEEISEGDELQAPDPDKPKKYRRIRKDVDSDENKGKKSSPKNIKSVAPTRKIVSCSSSDDEYVPLTQASAKKSASDFVHISPDSSDSDVQEVRNNQKKKTATKKAPRGRKTRSQRQKESDSDFVEEKTRSSSSSSLSSEPETRSLDGFVVDDDQESSLSETRSEQGRKRSISNSPEKPSKRTKNKEESSDSSDLFTPIPQSPPRKKKVLKTRSSPRQAQRKSQKSSSSSSSEMDFTSPKKRTEPLANDIASELRGFLPTKGLIKRKRNKSGGLIQDPREKEERGENSSEDSFIDENSANICPWNLDSASSSDQEVVPEPSNILDLDHNNFEPAESSSESDENEDYERPQRSCSSSNEEENEDDFVSLSGAGSSVKYDVIEVKCTLCENLDNTNFRGREGGVDVEWCRCRRCKIFSPKMQNYDRICCQEIRKIKDFMKKDKEGKRLKCISEHPCFDTEVLQFGAFLKQSSKKGRGKKSAAKLQKEFKNSTDKEKVLKCKQCFLKWIFGSIGDWGNTMVVPTCVVRRIRKKYSPSAGPLYFDPYKIVKRCKYARHCGRVLAGV